MSDNSKAAACGCQQRNYSIDALRILSMFMVVTAHALGQGGILDVLDETGAFFARREAAWILEIAAYSSVNCYALISGYVGINARYRYSNLALLWLRVVFHTVGITLFFFLVVPGATGIKELIQSFFPVTYGDYWYFTSYFALFFFIPLLNLVIHQMPQKQLKAVLVGILAVFSFLPTVLCRDIFGTSSNAWWLMILYIAGGYIKKYGLFQNSRAWKMLLGFWGMVFMTWFVKVGIEAGFFPFLKGFGGKYLIHHMSVTMLGEGIFLLLFFERIRMSSVAEKIVRFLAPMTFSVYIIHAHPLFWQYVLAGITARYAHFPVPVEIAGILLTVSAIYLFCSLLDLVREWIFRGLKLGQHLSALEEKCLGRLWQNGEKR